MKERAHIQETQEDLYRIHKKVSFQTEQSALTGSTKKKYYLKKNISLNSSHQSERFIQSNIFDLTNAYAKGYSDITNNSSLQQSRLYTNSLQTCTSKNSLIDTANPENKIVLPIITESKYNFKPNFALPKIKFQLCHEKDPFYIQKAQNSNMKNIKKMKYYQKIWGKSSILRQGESLVDRSSDKADLSIQNHNIELARRKSTIQFETQLRDRHKKQENRIGQEKAIPLRSFTGLKGKGGSVKSLFQEMYAIEQVYKKSK